MYTDREQCSPSVLAKNSAQSGDAPIKTAQSSSTTVLCRCRLLLFTLALTLGGASLGYGQTINISCGRGSNYTSPDGTVWQADTDFAGGNRVYSGYPVTGTTDPWLYSWARVGY